MGCFCIFWVCLSFFIFSAHCAPEGLLYDYVNIGKNLPNLDDTSSEEIRLRVPIIFYGQTYSTIFVNSNGLLSFQTDIQTFFNTEFPLNYPVIAPLYSNVDSSGSGSISYYETDNPEFLQKATTAVRSAFPLSDEFQATSLFVATWSSVGYHKNGVDKLNTFQVAIASDGDDSFVEFLYPENGIQWIQGTGDESGLPDARAQAGFVGADRRFYVLQGSGTDQVKYLEKWTNFNVPGQWIFRVGRLDADGNVEEARSFEDFENNAPTSCEKGVTQCHGFAKCVDYNDGFCCVCKDKYYGNGKYCVNKDVPLRVNGKVSGKINNEAFTNLDLQSYIVMTDGRAYTAVSKIPEPIGSDILSLQVLGSVLGWVFAKPVGETVNGFQLTGGVFNHTATLVFTNTNQKIVVRHKYLGLDVYDQVRLEVDIQGEIPHLPPEAGVTFADYEEHYTLTAPNTVQSSATRSFTHTNLDGTQVSVPFSIEQSFVFSYCKSNTSLTGTTWKFKIDKNFISYEAREQIARYGLSSKVKPLGDRDPCNEGKTTCGLNSACVVEEDSFRCVCNPGYQLIYRDNSSAECEDINECQTGLDQCDYNAQCINVEGSYTCRCNPGFEGSGLACESSQTCRNVQCPQNSVCVEGNPIQCRCLPGFTGNGQICSPIVVPQGCNVQNNCSPYGICTIDRQTNFYVCLCAGGYYGDGYNCEREPDQTYPPQTYPPQTYPPQTYPPQTYPPQTYPPQTYPPQTYPPQTTTQGPTTGDRVQANCVLAFCYCPAGYKLVDGTDYCTLEEVSTNTSTAIPTSTEETSTQTISCSNLNNCHRNAQCIYELSIDNYQCICNIGFEGDGYTCRESEVTCNSDSVCDVHATCIYNENYGRSTCVCDRGYFGNGKECRAARCIRTEDCPTNEDCQFNNALQEYECICKEGLVRDSQQLCVQLAGTCGGGVCAENSECLYDEEYRTHYCACKDGYVGDGITECRPRVRGCDELQNCAPQASCLFDDQQQIYQCKCNEGFLGDGLICLAERNCHTDPRMCHPYAVCLTNSDRKYICECRPGYLGNGTDCQERIAYDGNFLLLNQGKATLRIPYDPSQKNLAKLTHISEFQTAVGLDIDCLLGRAYWSDITGRVIKSSNYNGSNVTDFITTDVGSPEGLSIDWVARNIYWTDSTKDTIEVANIETKLRTTLFNTSLVNPRGIAVHPQRGKIFWTDWDRSHPKIEWANADGTGREIFLEGKHVQLPNSLVIDFETERLCYADAGTKKIECLDIDTRYKETIAENCTYPFGIAVTSEHIYWSDWIIKKIERVDKRTLKRLPSLNVPLGGSNKLYGLVAVPQRCLGLVNICQYYNTQCPSGHICLPDGSGSRRCLCGYKADSPNEKPTCIL